MPTFAPHLQPVGEIVAGSNPAAGAELTVTVPAGQVWELVQVKATLVTDATVANRSPVLYIKDASSVEIARFPIALSQGASLTVLWLWKAGFPTTGEFIAGASPPDFEDSGPITPGMILNAGYTITTLTTAIVAGDNWGAPSVYIKRLT